MSFEFDNHVDREWYRTILRGSWREREWAGHIKRCKRDSGNPVGEKGESSGCVQAKPLHAPAILLSLFQNTPLHPLHSTPSLP